MKGDMGEQDDEIFYDDNKSPISEDSNPSNHKKELLSQFQELIKLPRSPEPLPASR